MTVHTSLYGGWYRFMPYLSLYMQNGHMIYSHAAPPPASRRGLKPFSPPPFFEFSTSRIGSLLELILRHGVNNSIEKKKQKQPKNLQFCMKTGSPQGNTHACRYYQDQAPRRGGGGVQHRATPQYGRQTPTLASALPLKTDLEQRKQVI